MELFSVWDVSGYDGARNSTTTEWDFMYTADIMLHLDTTSNTKPTLEQKPYWNTRKPAFADVAAGFGALLAGLAVSVVTAVSGMMMHPDSLGAVASFSQALGALTMFLLLWVVLRARNWSKEDLGLLPLGSKGWHLLWEIPLMFVVSMFIAVLVRLLVPMEDAPSDTDAIASSASFWIVLALIIAVVVGPFVEEIIFRRLFMGWLDHKTGRVVSTALTCVIFALFHFYPATIIWVGVMGLFSALAVRWHNSVWAGYIVHLANNAVASLVLVSALIG